MTVKQLIEMLQTFDENLLVYLEDSDWGSEEIKTATIGLEPYQDEKVLYLNT